MLGLTKEIVALDFGSHSVKMMYLRKSKRLIDLFSPPSSRHYLEDTQVAVKLPKLLAFGLANLPPGAVGESGVSDEKILLETINNLADHLQIKKKDTLLITALASYEVMIKRVSLPMMTEDELESHMDEIFSQYIPYPVPDVNIDYEIMGKTKDNPKNMDVMLVAAKREVIDDYVRMIRKAGFEPAIIDVDFFALSNAFEVTHGIFPEKTIGLVHIGSQRTIVCIINEGVLTFTQDLPIGGKQINEGIRARLGRSTEDTERIKLGGDPSFHDKATLAKIYQNVTYNWMNNLQRLLQFYYRNYQDKPLDTLYLSGGSARIPELTRFFQAQMGIPTKIFNPLKHFASNKDRFDPGYVDVVGPQMAICVGLGLRSVSLR